MCCITYDHGFATGSSSVLVISWDSCKVPQRYLRLRDPRLALELLAKARTSYSMVRVMEAMSWSTFNSR